MRTNVGKRTWLSGAMATLLFMLLISFSVGAQAQYDYQWGQGPTGEDSCTDWSCTSTDITGGISTGWGYGSSNIPGAAASVAITNGGSVTYTSTVYPPDGGPSSLTIQQGSTLTVTGGSLVLGSTSSSNSSNGLIIGGLYNGPGTMTQSGGSVTTSNPGSWAFRLGGEAGLGVYNLSGTGILTVNGIEIIGNGSSGQDSSGNDLPGGIFNQTGGAHTVNGELDMCIGQYNQSGGTLTVRGSTGLLVVGFYSGAAGSTYNLSGGSVMTRGTYIGYTNGVGTFTQTGGAHTVSGNLLLGGASSGSYGSGTGTYNLSEPDASNPAILTVGGNELIGSNGYSVGTGVFNQTGGTHTVSGNLVLGDQYYTYARIPYPNTGTYTLSGGSLTVYGDTIVGNYGTGAFTQTGGTHTIGSADQSDDPNLVLGNYTGSTGTYTLSGGSLTVYGDTIVGNYGTGTFTQTGGTHTANNVIIGAGTYNLSGGTLNAANIDNYDTFNFSGGSLNANLHNGSTTTLSGSGTRTVNGKVSNSGTMQVTSTEAVFNGKVYNSGTMQLTGTDAVFNGKVYNSGTIISDPSTLTFVKNFTVGPSGSIQASPGDTYQMAANFLNNSTTPSGWSVGGATLEFLSGAHDFLPGNNKSFAWGTLYVDAGATVTLEGSGYVLDVVFGAGATFANILSNGYTLCYDPLWKPGLNDATWSVFGGSLSPSSVPLPGALWLLGPALAGLIAFRRRTRIK